MINENEIEEIKNIAKEVLYKMTVQDFSLDLKPFNAKEQENTDAVDINIELQEPQFLIGQNGQTLLDLQRLLKIMLNKKLKKNFYLSLDINSYTKKKIENLKNIANELADEVSLSRKAKVLPPMSAYERRIVHLELAQRKDVIGESQGEGFERYVVIKPVG